jgi:hypothetical protein
MESYAVFPQQVVDHWHKTAPAPAPAPEQRPHHRALCNLDRLTITKHHHISVGHRTNSTDICNLFGSLADTIKVIQLSLSVKIENDRHILP